ncbi:transposase [Planococcus antarcticus DSM 14505]|uniref:Transposase n=1 Tax=Planococcus antarcticus DSM 14505 TaxID=1185653 RepID=A0ABN4RGD7_9BACL|nr:transposase [Planococcus antarcticus]ANU09699.1 transposase [Planococcus antarcticus DSM 14505]ANU10823.1 transposase [Planococcus antarcticus DSM 14505]
MTSENRTRYTKEQKDAILKRMMPPQNESVKSITEDLGISKQTLYKWRKQARSAGQATPGNDQASERWNSEDKFLVVLETYAMTQTELAEYCRKKGLYKEQIDAWRISCLGANTGEINQTKRLSQELKEEKRRTAEVEKDLRKKEKALAEAAALLLLRKKARAIWGDPEDE